MDDVGSPLGGLSRVRRGYIVMAYIAGQQLK